MDLTQGNIKKQLINMAIPAGTGLFFYTLYNIVDTFYAGLISTEAVAGLAISYPCLLYTSPSPRDVEESRMPSSA